LRRVQVEAGAGFGPAEVQQQRAFANAARPDERNALPVLQQTEYLVDFGIPAVEFICLPDCAPMVEGIVNAHDFIVV
jgi:hypothetical protein